MTANRRGLHASTEPTQQNRAAALRILRGFRRVSQRELARRSGVHHASISAYERGRSTISAPKLERLLEALEISRRGWEGTIRHAAWIEYVASGESSALQGEAAVLAESVARSFEIHAAALLHLMEALPGGER